MAIPTAVRCPYRYGTVTGSARCSPVPMFPSPYVPRFMILVPMFPVFPCPYVPQSLCSPLYDISPYVSRVPLSLFPQSLCSLLYDISPYVSRVPQSLCYPEMFPSPVAPQTYITQSLCSPVPMFPIFHSPMFPSPYAPQPLCSPVHLFPSPFRCSPVPMFPQLIHQSLCSPLLFHKSFHSLYSPNMFPGAYVPQSLCSPN